MGHEGCGIVEEVGSGVSTISVGDKVVMHWRPGDGIEAAFPQYILDGKKISSGKVTTLSEYSIVSENRLTSVPDDTPENLCALLGCGLTTALGIIDNEIDLKMGESIMIVGCGGVGLSLIQGANLKSAYPIIAVDINEEKRYKSIKLGASQFINIKKDDIELPTVDIIVDTSGNPEVIGYMTKFLSETGRMILVGQPPPNSDIKIPNGVSLFEGVGKSIKASQGGKTNPAQDIPRYVKMHKAGILDIDQIVTHTFDLYHINEAFDLLRSGAAGRIMIRMNGEQQ
jgi:Zn-dependent alcohol dehydrogenase